MLAELLALRPLGIEPVEDVLELGLRDARALVLDADLDRVAGLARAQPMRPPGGLKSCALPIRLRSTCTSRPSTACTTSRPAGASSTITGSPSPRVASWISARVRQDRRHVHRLGRRARELGVHPATRR